MRPGLKFYTDIKDTSLNEKKFNEEKKLVSGTPLLFVERKEHSGNYIVFFETKDGGYEYHPFDNIQGLASGQKSRTLEGCISKAHTMGLFENDTPVMKVNQAPDGNLNVKVNFKESLKNKLRLREGAVCPSAMEDCMTDYMTECEEDGYSPDADDVLEYLNDCGYDTTGYEDAIRAFVNECSDDFDDDDDDDFEDFDESKKTSKNKFVEGQYTELSDKLENDIVLAANTLTQGNDCYVGLVDVLEALEYDFGYNYAAELSPKMTAIAKYLEQAGYIVEE